MGGLDIPDPPEWLLERILEPSRDDAAQKVAKQSSGYGKAALNRETARVAFAPEGQRNDTLNRAAFALGQLVAGGEIAETEAQARLLEAATLCGLPPSEAQATIRSGMESGKREPRMASPSRDNSRRSGPSESAKVLTTFNGNAAALLQTDFPPVRYVVPGLIPEGLTMLAGKPKIGKSWLTLDMAIAVATGGDFLGATVEKGDALYLGLEDNSRRMKGRLEKLLPFGGPPGLERLTLETVCPRLGGGAEESIAAWCDSKAQPRLIVVDTFGKLRGPTDPRATMYQDDVAALSPLHGLANERGVSIIVVHHVRKQGADDSLDTVSGTTGLAGTCDTILVLSRGADTGTTLTGRGRDLENEVDIALHFDRDAARFIVRGNPADVKRSDERTRVLQALDVCPEPMGPQEVADATGMKAENVKQLLRKMLYSGEVAKVSRGLYALPSDVDRIRSGHGGSDDIDFL